MFLAVPSGEPEDTWVPIGLSAALNQLIAIFLKFSLLTSGRCLLLCTWLSWLSGCHKLTVQ